MSSLNCISSQNEQEWSSNLGFQTISGVFEKEEFCWQLWEHSDSHHEGVPLWLSCGLCPAAWLGLHRGLQQENTTTQSTHEKEHAPRSIATGRGNLYCKFTRPVSVTYFLELRDMSRKFTIQVPTTGLAHLSRCIVRPQNKRKIICPFQAIAISNSLHDLSQSMF